MTRWVIYSTYPVFALCSMGAVAASPGTEEPPMSPITGEGASGGPAGVTEPTPSPAPA